MTLKGTIRALDSMANRAIREAERREKAYQKQLMLEEAAHETQKYDDYVERLVSFHKSCRSVIDWNEIHSRGKPIEPVKSDENEKQAIIKRNQYNPTFFDKLFQRIEKRKQSLEKAIEKARKDDEKAYQVDLEEYNNDKSRWELSVKILDGNENAYAEVLEDMNPLKNLGDLGTMINFEVHNSKLIEINLFVNSDDVIPKEKVSLLKSGKLSVKPIPVSTFNELYQDHICSCILRVAREIFAILPVEVVLLNAIANMLNTSSGYMEEQAIISTVIPRKTVDDLNMAGIDPSDSLRNFVHNMDFKKAKGFKPVEKLDVKTYL